VSTEPKDILAEIARLSKRRSIPLSKVFEFIENALLQNSQTKVDGIAAFMQQLLEGPKMHDLMSAIVEYQHLVHVLVFLDGKTKRREIDPEKISGKFWNEMIARREALITKIQTYRNELSVEITLLQHMSQELRNAKYSGDFDLPDALIKFPSVHAAAP